MWWEKGKRPNGRLPWTATLLLQSELAVRWLSPPLAVRLGSFLALKVFGDGAEFVDVAAGEAGTVGSVPVLLKDHGAAATRADSGWGRLHGCSFPLLAPGSDACSGQAPRAIQKGPMPATTGKAFRAPARLVDGFGLKG